LKSLRNISFYTAISVFTSGISFLLLPILTKYLSTEDYGTLAVYNATTRFVIVFISLGTSHVLFVKFIEVELKEFKGYFSSSFVIALITTSAMVVIAVFITAVSDSFFGLPSWLVVAIPLVGLLSYLFDVMVSLKMYQRKLAEYASLTLSKFFIEIIISLSLIVLLAFGWFGRFSGIVISLVIGIMIGGYYLRKENLLFAKHSLIKSKELLKLGFPLIFLNLGIMIMNLSDRFFIESIVGISDVGIYSIGAAVGGVQLLFVNASIAVFRPKIYESFKEQESTKKIQGLNLSLLVAVFLFLNLFSYLFFEDFINERYWAAQNYVLSISAGFVFWGIFNFYVSFFMYQNLNRLTAIVSVLGVLLNLILNYFLIFEYSTIGAAYATAITYFAMALLIYFLFKFYTIGTLDSK
jgi:O-antigen/teichoic acid export membrane protein